MAGNYLRTSDVYDHVCAYMIDQDGDYKLTLKHWGEEGNKWHLVQLRMYSPGGSGQPAPAQDSVWLGWHKLNTESAGPNDFHLVNDTVLITQFLPRYTKFELLGQEYFEDTTYSSSFPFLAVKEYASNGGRIPEMESCSGQAVFYETLDYLQGTPQPGNKYIRIQIKVEKL